LKGEFKGDVITARNPIIPYNSKLKALARELRKRSTLSEILLWKKINRKQILGYEFHRQVPMDQFIVDFYCHESMLAIEIDGSSHDHKYEADTQRQSVLESKGVHFLRFQDKEIKTSLDEVIKKIYSWLQHPPGPLQRGN